MRGITAAGAATFGYARESRLRAQDRMETGSGDFEPLRCVHCGDVIGVYEPLVACVGDEARETSRAAEPDLALQDTEVYHRACFATLQRRRGEE
jgi:hypothetical protein